MANINQIFVSIVTPVYNGEKYIAECIESVLAQTHSNWEYLIVDNCSTDRTNEIASRYAENDPRIRIIENSEFLSAAGNNNKALQLISPLSTYCKVVHADDWLYPDCLEKMTALAEKHRDVGIIGSYYHINNRIDPAGLGHSKVIFTGREIARSRLEGKTYLFGRPSQLLLRSEIVREQDPFYDVSWAQWDAEMCLRVLATWNFGFIHQVLSFAREHDASQTNTVSRPVGTETFELLRSFIKHGPVFYDTDEYDVFLHKQIKEYYRNVARNILRLRSRAVWNFHRQGMQSIGLKLSARRILLAFISEVFSKPISLIKQQLQKEKYQSWSS